MNGWIRSSRMKPLLLIVLALLLAQCGSDSEVVVKELECPGLKAFEGGAFSFEVSVGGIDDRCAGGLFNSMIDPGPYGPVTLPAYYGDLQEDIILTLPFVGEVTGQLTSDGKSIQLAVPDSIQVPVVLPPPLAGTVTVTARVSGALCPISRNQVDAVFAITVQNIQPSVPLIDTPCEVLVPTIGTLDPA